jgi:two-component system response regulator
MVGGVEAAATERPLRIVLVEDNPDDAEITCRAAQRAVRCDVQVIPDGAAAVAALAPTGGPPALAADLILLDLGLPGHSGIEVLRQLRLGSAHRRTPVIVLTTVADDDEAILECYAHGANSFLAKPATDARFAEALALLAPARELPRG